MIYPNVFVFINFLLVVRVRDMGHEGSAGVKDGRDRDEDDQVDVWCFLRERHSGTELRRRT